MILLEAFSEAEAGIEGDSLPSNARQHRRLRPVSEFALDLQNNISGRRQGSPVFGTSAHMHENRATFEFGDRTSHLRIPTEGADVVDNLGARGGSGARDFSLIGIN